MSLFPRSTFLYRCTFVARQEEVLLDSKAEGMKARLDKYCVDHKLQSIGICHKRLTDAEIGSRYVGDSMCWSISCTRGGKGLSISKFH